MDPTNPADVQAATQKIINDTMPLNGDLRAHVAETAVRCAVAEGLLNAMGKANDELGARIERLEACAKSALRRGDLEPLRKAMEGR